MKHTAILTALAGLTIFAASSGANAQTVVRIPRINNQQTPAQTKPATTPNTPDPGNAAFSYLGTPSMRKQVQDAYLSRIGQKNPSRAKMLASDFARTDPDKFYQRLIQNTGLRNYDVADALTAYQLTGYIIANNIKTMPPQSQIRAARQQTARVLAKNPRMNDSAARGKAGEEFKLMTVTLHYGLLAARRSGDVKDTKAYSDEIATLFAETGPNPRTLVLTNSGFARKP
jgi:hypothetical protein